ncbi:proline-rich extensin-like protein EPR1 [Prunus yedoensis var. nudiflora]|uniref:Proline-rich extensin-like protein EPR1 n=1 Tax=Prunus yedoensis var. nudiflora TaxID=2094558 RepID=A0A314Z3H8_PRUYE|nr:proline-rich extensin-like protein EPR1 [Prunus yedoensis var. nudiflora]
MSKQDGTLEYQCRTSGVVVEKMDEYIETDQCVKACGVDRKSLGISSDTLLDPHFLNRLCSPACYEKCPNVVELYFNMAEGEGVFLPYLCEQERSHPHRAMSELSSSGPSYAFSYGPDSKESSTKFHTPSPVSKEIPKKVQDTFTHASAPSPFSKEASRKFHETFATNSAHGPISKEITREFHDTFAPAFAPGRASKEITRKFHDTFAPAFTPDSF